MLYPPSQRWHHLYDAAQLRFAPNVSMKLNPSDRMHGQIAFLGYHEKELSKTVVKLAREVGGKFVDVGANIGYYSLLWVAQSSRNEAVAIEPSPRVHPLLQKNVEHNGFEEKIEVVKAAAGRERGRVQFDVGPDAEVGWGGITEGRGTVTQDSQGTIQVPQRRLDEVVEGPVSLLKADIEGAETWAFQGGESLLQSQEIQRICFENNRVRMHRLGIREEAPIELLRQHGYEVTDRRYALWAEPQN